MFEFRKADHDKQLMDEIYWLRYKVYCDEWGFEKPEDHPDGIEIDDYDHHSVHFAAFREDDGSLIGTVRLIRSSELGFPLFSHCTVDTDLSFLGGNAVGEISRLAISKELRRRRPDRALYDGEMQELEVEDTPLAVRERRKNENAIVLGLYRCLYKESIETGVTHLYAVMARGLFLLLKKISINFRQIGPEVNYHGSRTPYILDLAQMMVDLKERNSQLYQYFKD
ncbi:PEP-CTERM/exosortase system-associated acyltransferase [Geobacter sp.]|uniref:PEP-CTERM/exosortase system-associated acyltransferase n=1 Tax=Geobacter sp. TaxID=46610 RepID=UPI0027BA486D|nr:PEP-CTERM/exosortase system-associated acyltransferase [Geobacter sp.]